MKSDQRSSKKIRVPKVRCVSFFGPLLRGLLLMYCTLISAPAQNFTSVFTFPASTGTASWCDYDRDGDEDLLVTNSVLDQEGISAAWVDYDNDSHLDLIISANSTLLLHNSGGWLVGYTNWPTISGICSWSDWDGDGCP